MTSKMIFFIPHNQFEKPQFGEITKLQVFKIERKAQRWVMIFESLLPNNAF